MFKILLFSIALTFPAFSYADSHKDQQKHRDTYLEKLEMGYWKKEDCKKVSDGSGALLAMAGGLLEKSVELRDKGDGKASDKLFVAASDLSEVSANFAKTFETFCKK